MRHRKSGVKLNRTTSHRQAMFRNMVTSLLKHDRIKTTDAKAKELRRWADHIITLAKRGDLHARRLAMSIVREKDVVHRIFEEAAERFGSRNGGYTRIVKIGRRPGDAASISLVELVSSEGVKPTRSKKDRAEDKKASVQTKAVETKPEPAAEPEPVDEGEASETAVEKTAKKEEESSAIEADASNEKKDDEPVDSSESEK